jgi:hypothetical protein
MSRFLMTAPIMGALVLAACGQQAPQPPVDEGESVAPMPEQPPVGPGWTRVSSGEGAALRLEEDGALVAAIACLRSPARLHAETDRFQPVMSEDRFTLGVGGEAYALAADLEADREQGVEASGDIPPGLLDRLEAGGEITFNYGDLNLGPFPAIPEADRAAFVAECRETAG